MNTHRHVLPRLRILLAIVPWIAALAPGSDLRAQQDRAFGEEKRITAVDLMLGFEAGAFRDWATDSPVPRGLAAQDFEVLYDGRPRPVVALDAGAGDWQIVILFDAMLTGSAGLRWAAAALAGRGEELTALGEVKIVVADPIPWTLLPPTRDRDRLNASLSQLARFQEGRDRLLAIRSRMVKVASSGIEGSTLAAAAAEEKRIVRAQLDELLLELVKYEDSGPRRALLIASGGYDLEPAEFYRPLSGGPVEDAVTEAGADLGLATETLARTLAGYGWVVLPLVPSEGSPPGQAARIGDLRLTGPGIEVDDARPTPGDWEDYNRTIVWLFGARLEVKRRPKRAEAFLDLGTALQGQGKLDQAEDALRQAIYHFADDPKTADRQAEALARLGSVLAEKEEPQEANAALRLARRLDPDIEIFGAGPIPALLDAVAPLETLARATAGRVIRSARDLATALAELGHRVQLTYQVAGPADGDLHALEVRHRGKRSLVYPGWARSSTPEMTSAARARRLFTGEPTAGPLDFEAAILEDVVAKAGADHRVEIQLTLEPPAANGAEDLAGADTDLAADDTALRLTLGVGGPDIEPTLEHRRLGSQAGRDTWSYRVGFEMPANRSWLAVLVEDLETGIWGGRLIEVP